MLKLDKIKALFPILMIAILVSFTRIQVHAYNNSQIPTIDIPTVTSTPGGPIITVRMDADQDQINIRSGPGTFYEKIGVLIAGQSIPAKGRSAGGDWILIEYFGVDGSEGWVYAPLVNITPGRLPIVEPPPTSTPIVTPTIDPTLAAQFIVTSQPTLLPTYTAPAPINIPTYSDLPGMGTPSGLPMGLIIIGLGSVGIFVGLFVIARGR